MGRPDDRLLRPPSKMEGEDAEDLSNPNLIDLASVGYIFPNLIPSVHDFWMIQQISCIHIWLGGNALRCLVNFSVTFGVRYSRQPRGV